MIRSNVREILNELPETVTLVGAAKTRSGEEILEAIDAGLEIVGEIVCRYASNRLADAISITVVHNPYFAVVPID